MFLLQSNLFSQKTILFKDSITNKPCPEILVLDDKGKLLGVSNKLGEVYLENRLVKKIRIDDLSYGKKEILIKVNKKQEVLLNSFVNRLKDVHLTTKKYMVLTTYYRSYNMIDQTLRNFKDAEVKFIFKKERLIDNIILNHRIFNNTPDIDYDPGGYPYTPNLEKYTLLEKSIKHFDLVKSEQPDIINIVNKKNGEKYGTLTKKEKNIVQLDVIKNSKYFNRITLEKYQSNNLKAINNKKLKYKLFVHLRKVTKKYIDEDPYFFGKKEFLYKREFFIQNVNYLTKKEYKELKKRNQNFNTVSDYSKEFWKNLSNYELLPLNLRKQLQTKLSERK